MKTTKIFLLAAAAVLSASPAFCHQFWLEPSSFHPPLGALLSAQVKVGEHFAGEELPRNENHFLRFVLRTPQGEIPMVGMPGREPAGMARITAGGFLLLGYESRPTEVALSPDLLAIYLDEEGLEPFFKGDRAKGIEDHFSRYAKSLLLAGDAPKDSSGYDTRLGFALELVPEANPLLLKTGETLPVRLLQEGRPLQNVLVSARRKIEPDKRIAARTDTEGRARLALTGPGVWLINAVFLRPMAGGYSYQFESAWASLTFEIP